MDEAAKIRQQWMVEYGLSEEEMTSYNACNPPVSVEQEQKELEAVRECARLSEGLGERLDKGRKEILKELGLPEDSMVMLCMKCRKPVQCDEEGNLYCDHFDERKTYSEEELEGLGVVPIDMSKLI